MALYEAVVPMMILYTGTGVPPFWFFAAQCAGHLLTAIISNKFFWWYGTKAAPGLCRTLLAIAGAGWIAAGYLLQR